MEEGMVQALFTIFLLGDTFPTVSSNLNGERMQKLHLWEVYVQTYQFGILKSISSHDFQSNGVGIF